MCYLVRFNGTNLRSEKSGHRHGLPIESHELDLVGLAVSMNVHYRSDVAGDESFLGDIGRQDYLVVLSDHGGSYTG